MPDVLEMNTTTFYIELKMKTAAGYECFGCFELGYDREFAVRLFSALEGRPVSADTDVLHLDLIEKFRGLPVNIEVVSCTMEELCRNVRTITREVFKHINLGEMPA